MGIRVSWDDQSQTIIRYDFEGVWGWDDYCSAITRIGELSGTVSHPVGVIANFYADTMVPKGVSGQIERAGAGPKSVNVPSNMDVVVIIGGINFLEVVINGCCRFYDRVGRHFLLANSLDEARAIIRQRKGLAASAV